MRNVLSTAESFVKYFEGTAFALSLDEAQLIIDYLVDGNDYQFETDENGLLYRIDTCECENEEQVITFPDVLEQLTRANAELLAFALEVCADTEDATVYNVLEKRITEEQMISDVWKRIYHLVCA